MSLGRSGERVPSSSTNEHGQAIGDQESSRFSTISRMWQAAMPPLAAFAVVMLLWYLAIFFFDLRRFILPMPHVVLEVFIGNFQGILRNTWVTTVETAAGLAVAIIVGVILAVSMFEVERLRSAIMPWLVISQGIPKVAIAPLVVVWFGFGLTPKIVIAFVIAFFPVVISTMGGLSTTTEDEISLFRTITGSRWKTYRHLRIPRALPQFFDGTKVAVTLALVGAVVGEFVSSQAGLGYLVIIANRDLNTALTFSAFMALAVVGIAFFYAVIAVERIMIPWYFAQRRLAEGAGR